MLGAEVKQFLGSFFDIEGDESYKRRNIVAGEGIKDYGKNIVDRIVPGGSLVPSVIKAATEDGLDSVKDYMKSRKHKPKSPKKHKGGLKPVGS